jgi:putative ABC transport system permease protein
MLGIIIGVASVVTLMSLGRGVQDYITSQFEGLGADLLTVRASAPSGGFFEITNPLTMRDVEALADSETAPNVNQVAADYTVQAAVVYGYTSVNNTVRGVTASYFAVEDWLPQSGSIFTQGDIDAQRQIALLGTTTVEDLFGSSSFDPVGLTVRINGQAFTIVGVMEEQDATFQDPNAEILVPISTAQARLSNARIAGEGYEVSSIIVQVGEEQDSAAAESEIETYLLAKHNISNPALADFDISGGGAAADALTNVTNYLILFLAGIAAISLLVGGIGVMNIMLVSVSERTREIGLRKAVGAQHWDILGQFLIEAVILSLLGGAIGVAISWLLLQIAPLLLSGLSFAISADILLLATGVSSGIGIFFGSFPANRAASMNPIQALRFE